MGRLDDVLAGVKDAIFAAIVRSGIATPVTSTIGVGTPDATAILARSRDGGYTLTIQAVEPTRRFGAHLEPTMLDVPDTSPGAAAGATVTVLQAAQIKQRVQVTLWAATEALRGPIMDAIVESIGGDDPDTVDLTLADTTIVSIMYVSGPRRADETIANATLKRGDLMLDVTYGVYSRANALTLADVDETMLTVTLDDVSESCTIGAVTP